MLLQPSPLEQPAFYRQSRAIQRSQWQQQRPSCAHCSVTGLSLAAVPSALVRSTPSRLPGLQRLPAHARPVLLHLFCPVIAQSGSQPTFRVQQFESHPSPASTPPHRGSFQTRAPSPPALQTAPARADYARPSPPGFRPQTPPRRSHILQQDRQSCRAKKYSPPPRPRASSETHSLEPAQIHFPQSSPPRWGTGPDAAARAPSPRRALLPAPQAKPGARPVPLPRGYFRRRAPLPPLATAPATSPPAHSPRLRERRTSDSRHLYPLRWSPNLHQPFSRLLTLRKKQRNHLQKRPPQPLQQHVTRKRPVGDSG